MLIFVCMLNTYTYRHTNIIIADHMYFRIISRCLVLRIILWEANHTREWDNASLLHTHTHTHSSQK